MDNWIAALKVHPPSPALLEIFAFLDRERQALDLEYTRICSQPLEERIANGDTLGPLGLVRVHVGEDLLLELSLEEDHSRFREGDDGYLGPAAIGQEQIARGIPVTYVEFDRVGQRLWLRLEPIATHRLPLLRQQAEHQPLFFDARKMDLSNLYAQAAMQALDTPTPSPLVRALIRQESPVASANWQRLRRRALDRGLDSSQAAAFAELARFPLGLVQGPPGTGKTWVLGHVVAHLLEEGCRVLVCAMSHRAVNQALNACARLLDGNGGASALGRTIVKVGHSWQAMNLDNTVECVPSANALMAKLPAPNGPFLVGTSLARAPGLAKKRLRFDVVVVDEAGQITLPQALCAAVTAPQALFFGDHKQLPPIILAEHPSGQLGLSNSAFETLVQSYEQTMLTVSYRLNEELTAFPSRAFYGGQLHASSQSARRRLPLSRAISSLVAPLLDPAHPLVWAEVDWQPGGLPNEAEAVIVAACVRHAILSGLSSKEIGIISPFRLQNTAIRRALRRLANDGLPAASEVAADTVERMQGQERELVIISFALRDPTHIAQQAGFIYSPNRLNVAVTRAKTKCIVLGHPALLRPWGDSPAVATGAELFRQCVAQARAVQIAEHAARAMAREIGQSLDDARATSPRLLKRLARRFRARH